jgi:1-deoxy-D-xylulose-5-phosphate synthase
LQTQKGKGYKPAERNPGAFHGVLPGGKSGEKNFSNAMGKALCEIAKTDEKVCAVTASMCSGTGLTRFSREFPARFFDVGIAEPHALTFSAGLAAAGYKPCFAVYSTFLQRGYDNCLHDIALQNLHVTILADRAGIAGSDGPTHHGIFDVAFISHITNFHIYTPATFKSAERALSAALSGNSPSVIRYPNCQDMPELESIFSLSDNNNFSAKADFSAKEKDKNSCVIVTYGKIVKEALAAKENLAKQGVKVGIILLEKICPYEKPSDEIAVLLPEGKATVVLLEEGVRDGGAAMLLSDRLFTRHGDLMANKNVKILAIENPFELSSMKGNVYDNAGISAKNIEAAVL